MIMTMIALIVGFAILCGGIYYLVKEKKDKEARKIYTVTTAIGAVIAIGTVIKIALLGM